MKPANRSTLHAAVAALGLAGLGCAHGAGAPAAPAADRAAAPTRVLITGSRVPRIVDADHPVPIIASPVRIYTREQLDLTGRPDLNAALRDLDPSAR
ncbi:MAG: hypothetical protein HZB56_06170 [Deltaproteobacteria bacterium]|nr:hypothetical protein [Deltaproteobacteria bacterium]